LLAAELVVALLDFVEVVGDSALVGDVSVPAEGVYSAVPVNAFDPAAEDPEAAKEVAAPGPLAPEEAFV
jgi:hypothetical protein